MQTQCNLEAAGRRQSECKNVSDQSAIYTARSTYSVVSLSAWPMFSLLLLTEELIEREAP